MKTLLILLSIMCLLFSASAMAGGGGTTPKDPDQIGIYFDQIADQFCSEVTPVGYHSAYLIFTNLSSPTIGGWEVKITFEGGGTLLGGMPRGLAVNAATRVGEFVIGLGEPLVANNDGLLVVMDLILNVTDDTVPFLGYLAPTYFHSLPDPLPVFIDGNDPLLLKYLYYTIGDGTEPVFIMNDTCTGPIETENSSWGEVKSLYR